MHSKEGDEDICYCEKEDRTGGPAFPINGTYSWQQGLALGKTVRQAEGAPPPFLLSVTSVLKKKGLSSVTLQ